MRTFRIQIIDEKDEVVVQYPLPTTYQHNGLGAGTETPILENDEKAKLLVMLMDARAFIKAGGAATGWIEKKNENTVTSETLSGVTAKCDQCDYFAVGKTQKLADSNLKLHKKYKHLGSKVGSKA